MCVCLCVRVCVGAYVGWVGVAGGGCACVYACLWWGWGQVSDDCHDQMGPMPPLPPSRSCTCWIMPLLTPSITIWPMPPLPPSRSCTCWIMAPLTPSMTIWPMLPLTPSRSCTCWIMAPLTHSMTIWPMPPLTPSRSCTCWIMAPRQTVPTMTSERGSCWQYPRGTRCVCVWGGGWSRHADSIQGAPGEGREGWSRHAGSIQGAPGEGGGAVEHS